MNRKIVLTGGIATAKSTVLEEFNSQGFPILSSDILVAEAYKQPEIQQQIAARFGADVLFNDIEGNQRVNNKLLLDKLKTPEDRSFIEQLSVPYIKGEIDKFHGENSDKTTVVEAPRYFELMHKYNDVEFKAKFDLVLCLYSDEKIQKGRAYLRERARSDRSPAQVLDGLKKIMAKQLPHAYKKALADYSIDTGGSREEVREKVKEFVKMFEL